MRASRPAGGRGRRSSPNLASRVRTSAVGQSGTSAEKASINCSGPKNRPRAWSISPIRTAGPRDAVPSSSGTRPSSAASSVDLPEPFAPVIASRSPQSTCRSTGPSVNPPRRTTAPRRVATTAPARGAAAISSRSSHSLRGSSTTSSRSIRRSVCFAFAACFSDDAAVLGLDVLVAVLRLLDRVADALGHPVALHAGPRLEPGLGVGVLLVLLARVPAGHVPLHQVGVVAAVVHADQLLGEVELDDPGHGAGEELAVVADDDDARARPVDEPLELVEAGQVEVVGRLVEQQHVVAGQQQRGQARPGPPGRRRDRS